jgi:Heterokaryon incompatibility protein (HET)
MMEKIYEQAFQTVVWLDEGTEPGIESAVNFIYLLQDHLTKRTGLKKEELVGPNGPAISIGLLYHLFDEFETMQEGLDQVGVVSLGLGACALFFRLPWFRRVWVLQEVRKAPMTVMRCGHKTIGWGAVLHAALWHKNRTSTYLGPTVDLQTLRTYFKEFTIPTLWINIASKAENTAMAMLIFYLPNFGSTDPRDRLFSILGLAAETQGVHPLPAELRPNYLKPVLRVYTEFLRGMLKLQGKLDVLSTASRYSPTKKRQFLPDCPSWVPDFDTTNDVQSLLVHRNDSPLAKDVPMEIDEESPWNILRLKGFVVDRIDEIVSRQTPASDVEHTALLKVEADDKDLRIGNEPGAIYKIWVTKVRHLDPYPSKEDLLTAYLTCLHCGFFTGDIKDLKRKIVEITSLNDETLADFAAYWKKYDVDFADLPEHHRENLQRLSGSGNPDFLGQRLHAFCNGRCFLLTEGGLMGLAPPGAEKGDRIVILGGGSVPYILRPKRLTTGPFDVFEYSTMKWVISGGDIPCVLRPMRLTAGSTVVFEGSTAKQYEFIGECYVHGLTHESRSEDQQHFGRAIQMFDLV